MRPIPRRYCSTSNPLQCPTGWSMVSSSVDWGCLLSCEGTIQFVTGLYDSDNLASRLLMHVWRWLVTELGVWDVAKWNKALSRQAKILKCFPPHDIHVGNIHIQWLKMIQCIFQAYRWRFISTTEILEKCRRRNGACTLSVRTVNKHYSGRNRH